MSPEKQKAPPTKARPEKLICPTLPPPRALVNGESESRERALLATLVQEWPPELPHCVARLLDFAPESFLTPAHGELARVIAKSHCEGLAVHPNTLGDAVPLAVTIEPPLPLAIANLEAEKLWADFQGRRTVQVLAEALDTVQSNPGQAPAVGRSVRDSLDYLGEQAAPEAAPVSWLDVEGSQEDILIGPGRWLTRGSGLFVIAPTGAGKSTWSATQAFAFALGRPSLGLVPARPLKSLVFQSEDDSGDLQAMRNGIVDALQPTNEELDLLRENVLVITEKGRTGTDFLNHVLAPILGKSQAELVWINPLGAFFGADLNDQQAVAKFFRNTLNPILADTGAAGTVIHHTPKPTKDRAAWSGSTLAYFGAGSGDLANWSRETLVLLETRPGLYEMTATKRWRHLAWRDSEGRPTQTRLIAHGRTSQVWQDANADILEELGATLYSDSKFLALVPEVGIDKVELVKRVSETFAVADRTARAYVAGGLRECRRMRDGKPVKCSIVQETSRPRREIYPDQPANRPVQWVTRI